MRNERVKANPQFKDRLFRVLFGNKDMKANIISLYNALFTSLNRMFPTNHPLMTRPTVNGARRFIMAYINRMEKMNNPVVEIINALIN